jgi:plasmid stabilization system protein ParE
MIVHITDEAEQAFIRIGDAIALDNPPRALSFVREMREKCLGLADFPNRFPFVPRHERSGVRHRVHGNYLILYRVEQDVVVILTVLHGAMDYAEYLDRS